MKCQQIQRWLSDSVDGAIAQEKKAKIEAHLEACSECRDFQDQIALIHEEAKNLAASDISPEFSQDFSSRLRSTLIEEDEGKSGGVLHAFRNKWVFVPASVVLISLFVLIFVFFEKGEFQDEELYVFSFGSAMEEIYRDMGSDPALQEAFYSIVSASLNEMLTPPDWEEMLSWEDDLLVWEELSEEELRNLMPEIKKDRNS